MIGQQVGPTQKMATFALETRLEEVPPQIVQAARLLMLDGLGVALAAVHEPVGRTIIDYVRSLGGQPVAGVLGAGFRTSPPLAALANGTLAHALDYNDGLHLGTHTIPAALAVGEQLQASGRQVLEAFVVGREVGAAVRDAMDGLRQQKRGATFRGWYHVSLVGSIAAAVSAARLLQLDAHGMAMAIGIAAAHAGGVRRNQGTMTKALYAGNSASDGVHAALLAQRGFTADPEALEAPLGLFDAVCLPGELDLAPIMARLGQVWEMEPPLPIKTFPACTLSHKAIDAALAIKRQHAFQPEEVEAIEADLHDFSLFRIDPQEAIATGFSVPFLVAMALIDGQVGLDQTGEERLHDPRVRALMARFVPTPENAPDDGPERVTVRLRDGRALTAEVKGLRRLATLDEIEAKYRDCAGRALPPPAVERLYGQIMGIEALDDIRALMETATGG